MRCGRAGPAPFNHWDLAIVGGDALNLGFKHCLHVFGHDVAGEATGVGQERPETEGNVLQG